MSILYFDCFAGISGDMTLGALLDTGIDPDRFRAEMAKLGLHDEFELTIEKTNKWGIAGTDVDVIDKNAAHTHTHVHDAHSHEHGHSHDNLRGYLEIREIIEMSGISAAAKARAIKIFTKLGEAEAAVHGTTIDQVHFHEVGAIDSIVDIVGAAVLLDMINPHRIVCSPIHVGSGLAHAAHGTFGVPAPATALVLKGCPIYSTHIKGELCTPTGAAIAATMADSFGPMPAMMSDAIGHGFGKKDFGILNFLRVFIGSEGGMREHVTLLEANIDDMPGEAMGYAMDAIMQSGAVDVWFEPIYMKKNRPAVKLCALSAGDPDAIEQAFFDNTTTIGVRKSLMDRSTLTRRPIKLYTEYGVIDAKEVDRLGRTTVKPEYDSVMEAAIAQGKPYGIVYDEAVRTALEANQHG